MSTTTIADKFARSDDFASRIDGLYLPDEAWAVFALLEQPSSAEELSPQLEQPVDAVLESINVLLHHGLIRKQLRNWREFLAQKTGSKTPTAGSVTAPVAQAMTAGRPGAALAGWPKSSAPQVEPEDNSAPAPVESTPVVPALETGDHSESAPAFEIPSATGLLAEPPTAPATVEYPAIVPAAPSASPPPLFSDFPPRSAAAPATSAVPTAAPSTPSKSAFEAATVTASVPVVAPAPTLRTPTAVSPAPVPPRAHPETVMPVSFVIANEKARLERRANTAMTISFRLCAQPATTTVAWKLNPLLKAIVQKGGGGLPGQLLAYRVFIHVPADMMHAAGIQSLSLVDDSVVIRDRAFYDALCQAAHAVASLDLRTVAA